MNFASDNWAGAHQSITDNLSRHSGGFQPAYGNSPLDVAVENRFCEIFEREVAVFFLATGTAANSIAISTAAKPGGVAFAQSAAHVYEDECGAPEFYSGNRIRPIRGREGRMEPDALKSEIDLYMSDNVHVGQPTMVSMTQATESGTVYQVTEIQAIAAIAQQSGLPLHMDGARFANALVELDVTPAEMTWKAGVDLLSFGGTKNGCWCAEALVVFKNDLASQIAFHRKRAGHLFSKSRFVAAQFEAYFADGLWLELARHSNEKTRSLAAAISQSNRIRLAWKPQANEIFAIAKSSHFEDFKKRGLMAAPWTPPAEHAAEIDDDETLFRLVTSFATTESDVADFEKVLSE